jgi:hypothetical protein
MRGREHSSAVMDETIVLLPPAHTRLREENGRATEKLAGVPETSWRVGGRLIPELCPDF